MKTVTSLWPATSVPFLFVKAVMSMNVGRETRSALNAKQDSSVSKVCKLFNTKYIYYLNILIMENYYSFVYVRGLSVA